MDEVVYHQARIDRAKLRALAVRSDRRGLLQLAGHGAALAGTACLLGYALGSWWVVPAIVLHGIVLTFLFAPLHEAVHRTAFGSRWLNDAVAWVCGALLVLPPDYFRYFHFAHHRHTQDPARDPELASPKPATFGGWLLHVSGLPFWRAQVGGLIRRALGRTPEPFLPPRAAARVVREARLLLAIYAGIATVAAVSGSTAPLIYWIVPALVGQPFLRLFLLAEHTGCPLSADMLANTRTTLTTGIVRFFTWNMPFHAEHHAFPALPFHALPAAHREVRLDLKVIAPGYLAVNREILRAIGASAYSADATPS
ncbi:fatty acid desaturase family protein [Rhodospirillaceae bacterium SYSU D60014]|uniref:fatty acid desaturase family protein n=1 Tax=Virgifigura deserti TaxID=2268457 RepID=UPI000E662C3E